MIESLVTILGLFLVILGLLGSILPILPEPPLGFMGLLLIGWIRYLLGILLRLRLTGRCWVNPSVRWFKKMLEGSVLFNRETTVLHLLMVLVPLLHAPGTPLAEEVYRWTDEKGTVHFTDDFSKIPSQYSDRATKIEIPETPLVIERAPFLSDSGEDPVKKYLEEFDKKVEVKKRLETRVSELEEEQRRIEKRLKEIAQLEEADYQYYLPFRDPRTGRFVPVASPYYDEKVRLTRRMEILRTEIRSLEEKIAEIKRTF